MISDMCGYPRRQWLSVAHAKDCSESPGQFLTLLDDNVNLNNPFKSAADIRRAPKSTCNQCDRVAERQAPSVLPRTWARRQAVWAESVQPIASAHRIRTGKRGHERNQNGRQPLPALADNSARASPGYRQTRKTAGARFKTSQRYRQPTSWNSDTFSCNSLGRISSAAPTASQVGRHPAIR